MSFFESHLLPNKKAPSKRFIIWTLTISSSIFLILFLSLLINKDHPWFFPLDKSINIWITENRTLDFFNFSKSLDEFGYDFPILTNFFIFVGLLIFSFISSRQKKKERSKKLLYTAFFSICASAVTVLLTIMVKGLVRRPRPTQGLIDVDEYSFPSGHSASTAALCIVVALLYNRTIIWILATGFSLLIMSSRIYLGVHWFSDTLAGLCLALAVSLTFWIIYKKRTQKYKFRSNYKNKAKTD